MFLDFVHKFELDWLKKMDEQTVVVAEIVVADFVLEMMIEEKTYCFGSEYLGCYFRQEDLH